MDGLLDLSFRDYNRRVMLAFLVFVSVAVVFLFIGIAIGNTGREQLRIELANLRGKHETLSEAYNHLRELAGQAFDLAKARHFPQPTASDDLLIEYESRRSPDEVARSMANYVPPTVKNCPKCSVSVRAQDWPQYCPACGEAIGDDEILNATEIDG